MTPDEQQLAALEEKAFKERDDFEAMVQLQLRIAEANGKKILWVGSACFIDGERICS